MNRTTTTNAPGIPGPMFSHRREKSCTDGISGFARIAKPGGIVAWASRYDSFSDVCRWAEDQDAPASSHIQFQRK
jgi:hypothetical protein